MAKKKIALLAAMSMAFCLPANSFAADYYLEDGSISIHAGANGQTVTQSERVMEDLEPVIRNRDPNTATNNQIKITSEEGAVADVTIQDVNIEIKQDTTGSGIELEGDSDARLTLEGENTVSTKNGEAAVHVTDGSLGITGDGTLNATTKGSIDEEAVAIEGAAIGTNSKEDLNGSIIIGGKAKVNAEVTDDQDYDNEGAAIGTGYQGNISKDAMIAIIDQAVVNAKTCDDGAGIGTGADGNLYGIILVKDEAKVSGISHYDGGGIGTGENGDLSEEALIWITGKSEVDAKTEDDGAGIGVGRKGEFLGTIVIDGESYAEAYAASQGAAIGTGQKAKMHQNSKIIIGGKANIAALGRNDSTGIGSGTGAEMEGDIILQDEAYVIAVSGNDAAAVGADDVGDMKGSIQIIGKAKLVTGIYNNPDGIGMIGGGSYNEVQESGGSGGKYVIGENTKINGLIANNLNNLTIIFEKYTEPIDINDADFSQEEVPQDLTVYANNIEKAKVPVPNWKPKEEPKDPEVPEDIVDPKDPENIVDPKDPEVPEEVKDSVVSEELKEDIVEAKKVVTVNATSNVPAKAPQTSDQTNSVVWILMLAISLMAIYGVKKVRR